MIKNISQNYYFLSSICKSHFLYRLVKTSDEKKLFLRIYSNVTSLKSFKEWQTQAHICYGNKLFSNKSIKHMLEQKCFHLSNIKINILYSFCHLDWNHGFGIQPVNRLLLWGKWSEWPHDYSQYEVICIKEEVNFAKVFLPAFFTIAFIIGLAGNSTVVTEFIPITKSGEPKQMCTSWIWQWQIYSFYSLCLFGQLMQFMGGF